MSAPRFRMIGALICVLALIGLVVGMGGMTSRLAERAELAPMKRWIVKPVYIESFQFNGADVRIQTVSTSAGPMIEVHWRGEIERLPVSGVWDERLVELLEHHDWLRVLEMVRRGPGESPDEVIVARPRDHKLIIVTRASAPGHDPSTWGLVMQDDWRYTFLELAPGGGIIRSSATFEELEDGDLAYRRAHSESDAEPSRTARTWRQEASLHVTPSNRGPKANLTDDGFTELGWTWGVARSSILLLVIGATLFASSFVSAPARESASTTER